MSEANRKACHNWYIKHKEWKREYEAKIRAETRAEINRLKGSVCTICGAAIPDKRIILHKEDGSPHPIQVAFWRAEIKRNGLKPYVRLCYRCHVMVHWIVSILSERTEVEADKIVELARKAIT